MKSALSNILIKTEYHIIVTITAIIMLVNVMFTLCYNTPYSYSHPNLRIVFSLLSAGAGFLLLFIFRESFVKIIDRIDYTKMLLTAVSITALLALVNMLMSNYTAPTDMRAIIKNSIAVVNNHVSDENIYMLRFPYQSGIFLYSLLFSYILRIGDVNIQYIGMEYVNIIPVCITVFMLILITKELSDDRTAKIAALIISGFITIPLSAVQVYGNILSLPIILISIYFTIKTCKKYSNIGSCKMSILTCSFIIVISCFLSGFIKPNNMIIGIAISITLMMALLQSCSKNNVRSSLIILITAFLIIPIMFAGQKTAEFITVKASHNTIVFTDDEKQPMKAFIAMGLNDTDDDGPGYFIKKIGHQHNDINNVRKLSDEIISKRINDFKNDPLSMAGFFTKKVLYTWSDPTYGYGIINGFSISEKRLLGEQVIETASQKIIDSQSYMTIMRTWNDMIAAIIAIFTLIHMIKSRKTMNAYMLLCGLIVTGGFLFHLVWETKPEYAYTYFLLLIPYAAIGIIDTIHKHNRNIDNEDNKVS